ncbi:MAG: phosphoribosylanthranilate isomerase [Phycisphaerae bacterium]|nr:phosphoribosylanthranilate isomerase [Phycisphaerae bacterium]
MARTRIKVCGVRDTETALVASECGADAIGLVFAEGSVRRVEPEAAWEIACVVPPFVAKVGLFVDAGAERYHEVMERCPCDYGQLHGGEGVDEVRECGPRIIKAVRFDESTIGDEIRKWNEVAEVEALLIDGGAGGEGRSFDWRALARVQDECVHPIILAGGLTAENVGEAIRIVRPWAVDVSSGVERERGIKDARLIEAFCDAVRAADEG